MNKAWIGAAISGLSTLLSMASQVDFSGGLAANTIRDLIVYSLGSALAGLAGVYLVPNKPKANV